MLLHGHLPGGLQGVELRRSCDPQGPPQLTLPAPLPMLLQLVLINARPAGDCSFDRPALLTVWFPTALTRSENTSSDKELVGQGLANIVAGPFCRSPAPGSGATPPRWSTSRPAAHRPVGHPARADASPDDPGRLRPGSRIPLAVLAAYRPSRWGSIIVDWGFLPPVAPALPRVPCHLSGGGAHVPRRPDVAGGVGIFLANIITMTR